MIFLEEKINNNRHGHLNSESSTGSQPKTMNLLIEANVYKPASGLRCNQGEPD
jgi:calcineurin-like phosphoesterase family protein